MREVKLMLYSYGIFNVVLSVIIWTLNLPVYMAITTLTVGGGSLLVSAWYDRRFKAFKRSLEGSAPSIIIFDTKEGVEHESNNRRSKALVEICKKCNNTGNIRNNYCDCPTGQDVQEKSELFQRRMNQTHK